MKKQTKKPSKNVDWVIAMIMLYVFGFSFKASGIGWLKTTGIVLIIMGFVSSLLFAFKLYHANKDKINELKRLIIKRRPGDSQLNGSPYKQWKTKLKN